MTKSFKATNSFVNYIQMIGFKYTRVNSERQYYVNGKGNQIAIDPKLNQIIFINKYGNVIDKKYNVTSEQIDKFSKKEGR